ncbi:MAG: FHA domain-containing protein [Thermoleophilia bacterium]|nr:FHA domain-containing protein [Thermoleophilia bacterium]
MGWSVKVRSGEALRLITIDDELTIGRGVDGAGGLPEDRKVSRRHARFLLAADGALLVEDLGSANGTEVNGVALEPGAPRELDTGDVIAAGSTVLEVGERIDAGPGPSRPLSPPAPGRASEPDPARLPTPVEQLGSPSSVRPPSAPAPGPIAGEVLHAGGRAAIGAGGVTIGADPGCEVVVEGRTAAGRHATIRERDGRHYLADLGAGTGTRLNGELLRGESRWLNSGDSIEVGGEALRYVAGERTRLGAAAAPAAAAETIHLGSGALTIGRDPANEVVLDDPNVSRFHAEVRPVDGASEVRDLGSRNGTRVDGGFVGGSVVIRPGAEIGIGPFRLVFDGSRFVRRDDRGAMRLRGEEVSMQVRDKLILNRASIAVEPGEFVVVIGESGSGKTTLVKALAGVTDPTGGRVLVSGEPVQSRLTDIGYVPQDEIVHRGLTVVEGLRYAAWLRLPGDSTREDIDDAVDRVLEELDLAPHADTRIGSLSGGQRKRVGVGTELVNRPSLLFLDEPTTGLDPGLETRLMEIFRELAEPGRRSVTVVTHATKNLDLPDKVCVMGQGGELCFFGPPEEAKEFFGTASFDGIYSALEGRPAPQWRREFEAERGEALPTLEEPAPAPSAPRPRRPRPDVGRQSTLLARRYLTLMVRDRRNLAILLGQVPLIALGIALLFKSDVLRGSVDTNNAALLLFLVVTSMIWLGAIDAAREIIKERPLMERERAIGVRLSAYLGSKSIVLFGLVVVQAALLGAVTFGLRPLYESPPTYLALFAVLAVTGFVSVAMGLWISSLVSSEDQAASFIPLALIPQLLFGGAIVAVEEMSGAMQQLSKLVYSRWAFADIGAAIDLGDRIRQTTHSIPSRYTPDFFELPLGRGVAILAAFLLAFLALTYVTLEINRREG